MKVTLISSPNFHGASSSSGKRARPDQLQGTDAERLAEYAGRKCYDSFGRGRDSAAFAENILEHGHVNVLYHAWFSLDIEGVSRNLTHELVRHHVGFSPSMRSTRYCYEGASKTVEHPVLRGLERTEAHAKAEAAFDRAWREAYDHTIQALVAAGHDKKTAHGAAARYLPNGIETSLVWSGNIAAFRSLLERRSIEGVVDAEFVELCAAMREVLRPLAPAYFG